jgi:hypothetical protein
MTLLQSLKKYMETSKPNQKNKFAKLVNIKNRIAII